MKILTINADGIRSVLYKSSCSFAVRNNRRVMVHVKFMTSCSIRLCLEASMMAQSLYVTPRFYYKDHYKTLGIKPSATQKEVKAAFVQLSKKFHPDVNRQDPKSHEKFIAITDAYSILSKPDSRVEYDLSSGIAFRNKARTGGQGDFNEWHRHYNFTQPFSEKHYNHNSLFNKFRRNYRLQFKLWIWLRLFPMSILMCYAVVKWVEQIKISMALKETERSKTDMGQ